MLNQDQQQALIDIKTFLINDDKFYVLSGIAGSGKTYLLNELHKQFYKFAYSSGIKHNTLVFTATTNKAVAALSSAVKVEPSTIHSYLGIKPIYDYTLKKNKLTSSVSKIKVNEVIIIDEYSYIDKELFDLIVKQAKDCKIIFVGDSYQLPPVNAEVSYIDQLKCGRTELHKVMRQSDDNPIQALSIAMREAIRKGTKFPKIEFNDNIKKMSLGDFQRAILADIKSNHNFKHLAFKNVTVQKYNNEMHKLVNNVKTAYNLDDLIEVNSFIKSENDVSLKTGTVWSIDQIEPSVFMNTQGYKVIVADEEFFIANDVEAKDRKLAETDDYHTIKFINSYWLDARHAYSCTIHKSQGSTFDRVYINNPDLSNIAQYKPDLFHRLLYVAFSRAKSEVIFIGN